MLYVCVRRAECYSASTGKTYEIFTDSSLAHGQSRNSSYIASIDVELGVIRSVSVSISRQT